MKPIKCRLYISTRTRMIDMGEFESKAAAKRYVNELGFTVIYTII